MKRTVALIAAALLSFGAQVPPTSAVPMPASTTNHVAVSVPTAYVRYPNAVPGRYCKKEHRGDWTKTAKYGKVKCVNKSGWRWKRI